MKEDDTKSSDEQGQKESPQQSMLHIRSNSTRDTTSTAAPNNKKQNFNANVQNSFSADSPYFSSYVENEMNSMRVFHDTLNDVAARTKTFGKCSELMSESTRRLARACRLEQPRSEEDDNNENTNEAARQREVEIAERRRAVGDDMASLLGVMAEMLEEISEAQTHMTRSFEATMVSALEEFASNEYKSALNLNESSVKATASADELLAKYLNGRHAAALSTTDGGGNVAWNKFNQQVENHGTSFLSRFQNRNKKDSKPGFTRNASPQTKELSDNPAVQIATTAANLRLTLEQVRLAQATAELKRFQLLKHIVAHKQRRKFEIGENVLASLHGVRAYYHHCSDLVTGIVPTMTRLQVDQTAARNTLEKRLGPSWKSREMDIQGTIDGLKEITKSSSMIVEAISQGDKWYTERQAINLEEIEEKVQIWQLPNLLADSTRLQRDPTPGIFVEGWLYKKSDKMISLSPWRKRWFMMDSVGIYYFRNNDDKEAYSKLERIKICDVVLCKINLFVSTDVWNIIFNLEKNRFSFYLFTIIRYSKRGAARRSTFLF